MIELRFDSFHQRKRVAGWSPDVQLIFDGRRRFQNDSGPARSRELATQFVNYIDNQICWACESQQPSPRRLGNQPSLDLMLGVPLHEHRVETRPLTGE